LFVAFYIGAMNHKNKSISTFTLIIFLGLSLLFRIMIPFEDNADYYPYSVLRTYEFNITKPLHDPILALIYNSFYAISFGSKAFAIKGLYWTNFFISTSFFVFLIRKKELPLYKRVMFFSLYYFLFTYTLLRNGPGYILIALFYFNYLNSNLLKRKVKYLWLSILFHYSTLSILVLHYVTSFTKKQLIIAFVILVFALIGVFIGLELSLDIISEKYASYSKSLREEQLSHKIWYIFVCSLFVLTFIENKYLANTKFHFLIFLVFLVLYKISHIAGYRFSIYCIMYYLLLQPSKSFFIRNQKLFNFGSFVFVLYFIFTFYDTHYR